MALTPMMQQYFQVKNRYASCIVFFRLGDFYELFFEDTLCKMGVTGCQTLFHWLLLVAAVNRTPAGKQG
ncbi:MAG: hypothetical protein ATN35_02475 [Epulopiscium sp. Nele67-Bin004]|nr:MAG: hypothetical protein ATN35_02475 [Epulopiscium sp. Nele67-Bin004]